MSIEILTSAILSQMSDISKPKRKFFIHLMVLLVSLRGRFNFMNLGRYGLFNEVTYRQHFSKGFDFMGFNQALITVHCSKERIITFDPSYLPKSGKQTYGVGRFWSGSAQQAKKGLELSGFSCIDLRHWTALHLYAQQTVPQEGESLMGFYINLLRQQAPQLFKTSNILCVAGTPGDAYFSKHDYVTAATSCGFTLVSRLRNDAVLRYLYQGDKTGKKGRPKTYDGTVDKNHLCPGVFTSFQAKDGLTAYQAIVHIKALKVNARVVILPQEDKNGKAKAPKVFFSTDLEMDGAEVLRIYRARFQCEFLYRDAKQHMGLEQAQCRSKEKIHYHLNASLTAISIAKAAHYINQENKQDYGFSMADIKTQYVNELLLRRFITVFGINPKHEDNSAKLKLLYNIGRIAA